jgi:hypothetical protein
MQRARFDHADLSEADKRKILRDNAFTLLSLENGFPKMRRNRQPFTKRRINL